MGGQLGLPAETSQGRTEEIALLLPHVELGQTLLLIPALASRHVTELMR